MRCVVDLHCHSSASFDSRVEPAELVRVAAAAGLTHLAITDHDRLEGALRARDVAPDKLTIIIGQEIRSTSGDLIALFVESPIESGLSVEESVAEIRVQHGLVGLPHGFDPYRPSIGVDRVLPDDLRRLADLVDYVEIHNGRVTDQRANGRAAEFAKSLEIPGVAVSDAHTVAEVGTCAVVLEGHIDSAQTLREALAHPVGLIVREASRHVAGDRPGRLGRLGRRLAGRE
jgi:predicted metal-dependent phosphoesterase TrpH